MAVDKDTIISDVLKLDPDIAEIFYDSGMFCITCPASVSETIEEACYVHGIGYEKIIEDINDYLKYKESESRDNDES